MIILEQFILRCQGDEEQLLNDMERTAKGVTETNGCDVHIIKLFKRQKDWLTMLHIGCMEWSLKVDHWIEQFRG